MENKPTQTEHAPENKEKNRNLKAFQRGTDEQGNKTIYFLKICSNCGTEYKTENREAKTCSDDCQHDNTIRGSEKIVFYPSPSQIESSFNIHIIKERNENKENAELKEFKRGYEKYISELDISLNSTDETLLFKTRDFILFVFERNNRINFIFPLKHQLDTFFELLQTESINNGQSIRIKKYYDKKRKNYKEIEIFKNFEIKIYLDGVRQIPMPMTSLRNKSKQVKELETINIQQKNNIDNLVKIINNKNEHIEIIEKTLENERYYNRVNKVYN